MLSIILPVMKGLGLQLHLDNQCLHRCKSCITSAVEGRNQCTPLAILPKIIRAIVTCNSVLCFVLLLLLWKYAGTRNSFTCPPLYIGKSSLGRLTGTPIQRCFNDVPTSKTLARINMTPGRRSMLAQLLGGRHFTRPANCVRIKGRKWFRRPSDIDSRRSFPITLAILFIICGLRSAGVCQNSPVESYRPRLKIGLTLYTSAQYE